MTLRLPRRLGTRIAVAYLIVLVCVMALFMAGTAGVLYVQMQSQLEHYAIQDIETVEGLISITSSGAVVVREDYHNHPESRRVLERYLEILSPEGRILFRNERLGTRTLGGKPAADEGTAGYSPRRATLADGTRVLLVSRRHSLEGNRLLIRLAHGEEPIRSAVAGLVKAALWMIPVMVGLAVFAGHRMSRRVLAPIREITSRAEHITSNQLHERLPVRGTEDELDQLAKVFNRTLAHLEESFGQLRRFTADASHELRTPLAAIRAIGEVGLQRGGCEEDYRELVGSMLEEAGRMTRLVERLLMISRAESGAVPVHSRSVSMSDLVAGTVALLEPLADEKEQHLRVEGAGPACVEADPLYLRQALINVLDNAIKYSPPRETITLRFRETGPASVCLEIEDRGPGIAPEHLARIFDRFYRVDHGRSRAAGGVGLGLAIAYWAVTASGGSIDAVSEVGKGSTFRITLRALRS